MRHMPVENCITQTKKVKEKFQFNEIFKHWKRRISQFPPIMCETQDWLFKLILFGLNDILSYACFSWKGRFEKYTDFDNGLKMTSYNGVGDIFLCAPWKLTFLTLNWRRKWVWRNDFQMIRKLGSTIFEQENVFTPRKISNIALCFKGLW